MGRKLTIWGANWKNGAHNWKNGTQRFLLDALPASVGVIAILPDEHLSRLEHKGFPHLFANDLHLVAALRADGLLLAQAVLQRSACGDYLTRLPEDATGTSWEPHPSKIVVFHLKG